jgi:hypothetical protein
MAALSQYVHCRADGAERQIPRATCVLMWYRACPACPHSRFTAVFQCKTKT